MNALRQSDAVWNSLAVRLVLLLLIIGIGSFLLLAPGGQATGLSLLRIAGNDTGYVDVPVLAFGFRFVLFLLLMFCSGLLFFRWIIREVKTPLDAVSETLAAVAEGDFSMVMPDQTRTPFTGIRQDLMSLSMDQQEFLLLVWKQMDMMALILDPMTRLPEETFPAADLDRVRHLQSTMEMLREMIRTHRFFDVRLDDGVVLSDTISYGRNV